MQTKLAQRINVNGSRPEERSGSPILYRMRQTCTSPSHLLRVPLASVLGLYYSDMIRLLIAASFVIAAQAAVLRNVYVEQNGRDVRFEVLVDKWWDLQVPDAVQIPAGTTIKLRNGTAFTETQDTIPIDMSIAIRYQSLDKAARLGAHICFISPPIAAS